MAVPEQRHEGQVPVRLSVRQHEVAHCVAAGMTDAEIGERLGISPRTVRMHCDALRTRLRVQHRLCANGIAAPEDF